ncbi:MAG: hypothetical protein HFG72_02110 [Hungatella sp.]|nr:hypothetical protein [Hungatella sp.]
MAIHIPWDKYETALLIDACHNYNLGNMSRREAIVSVSQTLRRRAVNKGIIIDDIFRNENGISMQFTIMNGLLCHKKIGLHNASKLFVEMADLYRNNRDEFEKIVKEAKDGNPILRLEDNAGTEQKQKIERGNSLLEYYREILRQNYPKGFRIESKLEMKRFRKFWAQRYADQLEDPDEIVRDRIRSITIQFEDFVYLPEVMITESLQKELFEYISKCFKKGKKVIYYTALYKLYSLKLQERHINNPDMLKLCLGYINQGNYIMKRECLVAKGNVEINPAKEVEAYLIASNIPVGIEKIYKDLSYLPEDKILKILTGSNSAEFIWNKRGEYFHADIVDMSQQELDDIARLIQLSLDERGFMGGDELIELIKGQYPSIRERYFNLSDAGLRNVLGYKLKDRFTFNGKIISAYGKNLTTKDIFLDYIKLREKFTLQELKILKSELGTGIYFDNIYENAFRINRMEFVSKRYAAFDVKKTDMAIDRFCTGDYISLGEIHQFGSFPYGGFPWNVFLLESYVAGFSEKYKLLHMRYGEETVSGAIVKKAAAYKDFDDLLVHIFAVGTVIYDRKEALEYLWDRGFIAKRRYEGIERLLERAAILRG